MYNTNTTNTGVHRCSSVLSLYDTNILTAFIGFDDVIKIL